MDDTKGALLLDPALLHVRESVEKLGKLAARQLDLAMEAFDTDDLKLAETVVEKDDVADNLNLSVEEECFALVASGRLSDDEVRFARCAVRVAQNLERIADSGCHIAKRLRLLRADGVAATPFDIDVLTAVARISVHDALDAFMAPTVQSAERACQREPEMDEHFVVLLMQLRARMQSAPDEVPYLLHVHSVMKYLEKVGDYVLNIGEQALFLATGRRMKFEQFQQLDRLTAGYQAEAVHFKPYWDGISGALVGGVEVGGQHYLYKEGSQRKIAEEVAKLQQWEHLVAGMTPRVVAIATLSDREALLREFVQGTILGDLFVGTGPLDEKQRQLDELLGVVGAVWAATLRPAGDRRDSYVQQVRSRLDEVYRMHPELAQAAQGGEGHRSLADLLAAAADLEPLLAPTCDVWLHGDFNINNVIVDAATGRQKFIDVHRSHYGDYLADLGVFTVSLGRQVHVEAAVRADLKALQHRVRQFAGDFALEHGDWHWARRFDLALARSNLTSARVVMEPEHAHILFSQGMALLENVVEGAWQ